MSCVETIRWTVNEFHKEVYMLNFINQSAWTVIWSCNCEISRSRTCIWPQYHLEPKAQNPKPKAQNPKPKTQNQKPRTQIPKPKARNPKPKTHPGFSTVPNMLSDDALMVGWKINVQLDHPGLVYQLLQLSVLIYDRKNMAPVVNRLPCQFWECSRTSDPFTDFQTINR